MPFKPGLALLTASFSMAVFLSISSYKVVSIAQANDTFTMPAEFEEIDSIWMAYPVYENSHGQASQKVQEEMIKALEPYIHIDLMVQDETESKQVAQWLKEKRIPSNHVRLHIVPHTDIWVRDMGPIFLRNNKNQIKIADFGFNNWSYDAPTSESSMTDESVDRSIARDMKLSIIRSNLISEGGDREFNGKGTRMVTEAVELNRNPEMSKQQIEDEFRRIFNIKKVIWLRQGIRDDDLSYKGKLPGNIFTVLTTGGHIDEFARFVSPNTILLAQVSDEEAEEDKIAQETKRRMEENYEILKNATDQDGNKFNIVRVPIAAPIYAWMDGKDEIFKRLKTLKFEDGSIIQADDKIKTVLAASYLNFVITNKAVLIPSYWKPGRSKVFSKKDEDFKKIIKTIFPDRTIVQINPENLNMGGGGMHCITQQMPKQRSVTGTPSPLWNWQALQ